MEIEHPIQDMSRCTIDALPEEATERMEDYFNLLYCEEHVQLNQNESDSIPQLNLTLRQKLSGQLIRKVGSSENNDLNVCFATTSGDENYAEKGVYVL